MLVLYNGHLIITVFIGFVTSLFLSKIDPSFSKLTQPLFWVVQLFYSSLFTGLGFRPRLYTLPFWFLSSIFLIWSSIHVHGIAGLFLSIISVVILVGLSLLVMKKRSDIRKEKSLVLLKDFLRDGETLNVELLCYYPKYIYTDNPIYERLFHYIFERLQYLWFSNQEVKNRFMLIIEKLDGKRKPENRQHNHFKAILEEGKQDGISEYLIKNLMDDIPTTSELERTLE